MERQTASSSLAFAPCPPPHCERHSRRKPLQASSVPRRAHVFPSPPCRLLCAHARRSLPLHAPLNLAPPFLCPPPLLCALRLCVSAIGATLPRATRLPPACCPLPHVVERPSSARREALSHGTAPPCVTSLSRCVASSTSRPSKYSSPTRRRDPVPRASYQRAVPPSRMRSSLVRGRATLLRASLGSLSRRRSTARGHLGPPRLLLHIPAVRAVLPHAS